MDHKAETGQERGRETDLATRVLVENEDHALLWATEQALAKAGYVVTGCPGPEAPKKELPAGRCPVLKGATCPLAEGADVVIFGLDLRRDSSHGVLSEWKSHRPSMPVLIEELAGGSHLDGASTEGLPRISPFASASELIASVERALREPKPQPDRSTKS